MTTAFTAIACFLLVCFFAFKRIKSIDGFMKRMIIEEGQFRQRLILAGRWDELPFEWRRHRSLPQSRTLLLKFWSRLEKYDKPLAYFYPELKLNGENK